MLAVSGAALFLVTATCLLTWLLHLQSRQQLTESVSGHQLDKTASNGLV